MESSNRRASSAFRTGVFPFLTTCLGPRTACAGFTLSVCPTTGQSNSIRSAARCCFTVGFRMRFLENFDVRRDVNRLYQRQIK